MSTLAEVLLQYLKKSEPTIHLEYNNQPGTPWKNRSAQTDLYNSLFKPKVLLFLLLSNSRSLRSPWPTTRRGSGRGGRRRNRHRLLWWSTTPWNSVRIFPGTISVSTWRFAQISDIFCTYTIFILVPNPARPNQSLVDTHWSIHFLKHFRQSCQTPLETTQTLAQVSYQSLCCQCYIWKQWLFLGHWWHSVWCR